MNTCDERDEYLEYIHPYNYEYLRKERPHRLYVTASWDCLEIHVDSVDSVIGAVRESSRIILWVTHFNNSQQSTHIYTYLIDPKGKISIADMKDGIYSACIETALFYMVLNPLSYFEQWLLSDVKEAQKNNLFDTKKAFGIKTQWGHTRTFHPDLEVQMDMVKNMIRRDNN